MPQSLKKKLYAYFDAYFECIGGLRWSRYYPAIARARRYGSTSGSPGQPALSGSRTEPQYFAVLTEHVEAPGAENKLKNKLRSLYPAVTPSLSLAFPSAISVRRLVPRRPSGSCRCQHPIAAGSMRRR